MVAVLQLRSATPAALAGATVRAVPGVISVATDLGRQQLVVRYDGSLTSDAAIRAALRAWLGNPRDAWLDMLPRVARAVPLAAAML